MSYAAVDYAAGPYAAPRGAAAPPVPSTTGLPTGEFAFEFDAGTWIDLWPWVVDLATDRGRNAELGAFETGRGIVTLRNEDRRFDPEYAAGPWYGKLRPNRRVRLRMNFGGATYPVMVGYVDRITQQYGGPNDAVAVVEFSDLFKVLNRQELPASVYSSETATDQPTFWWRLDEPSGSTTVLDAAAGRSLAAFGAPTLGAAGLVTRDGGSAMSATDANSGFVGTGTYIPAGPLPDFTIEATVKTTATGVAFSLADLGGGVYITIGTDGAGGKALLRVYTTVGGSGNSWTAVGTTVLTDNNPHHLAGTWSAAGATPSIYVDGVLQTVGTSGNNGTITASQELVVGNLATGYIPAGHTSGIVGTTDETALYLGTVLSAARIAAHASARAAPWRGDLPGVRIDRILTLAGVPAADRRLDTGSATLQSSSLGGTPLAYVQNVADTEIGSVFVTRDGQVRFIGRNEGVGADPFYLTSQATLTDSAPAAGEVPYRTVELVVDDNDIVTRATVSRDGSVAVTYQDAAAITEFGIVGFTAEGLLHDTDAYSLSYAQWIVNSRKTPETRIGTVAVSPRVDPATAFPEILSLEIGDRVTVRRRPKTGAALTIDARIEAIRHRAFGQDWQTTFELTPFNQTAGVPVGIWDTSLWDQAVWGI